MTIPGRIGVVQDGRFRSSTKPPAREVVGAKESRNYTRGRAICGFLDFTLRPPDANLSGVRGGILCRV